MTNCEEVVQKLMVEQGNLTAKINELERYVETTYNVATELRAKLINAQNAIKVLSEACEFALKDGLLDGNFSGRSATKLQDAILYAKDSRT